METLFPCPPQCEIVSSRTFNVPKALLFSAWSNPDHLKNWWGPSGFTNTFTEFDFREGGKWDFVMHGPEKGNYHNLCEFVRIHPPNLIAWKRHSKPLFKVVFTFEALSEKQTNVLFRMVFDTEEECNKIRGFATGKNQENFDRLEQELKKMV